MKRFGDGEIDQFDSKLRNDLYPRKRFTREELVKERVRIVAEIAAERAERVPVHFMGMNH